MATLSQMRSDVYAGLTAGIVNADLRIPVPLLDFWIISGAVALHQKMSAQNGVGRFVVDDWMFTRFKCLPTKLEKEDCDMALALTESDWYVSLPFTPVSLPHDGGMGSLQIQQSGLSIPIIPYSIAKRGSSIRYANGDKDNPTSFRYIDRVYIRSCGRNLEDAKIEILAIPLIVNNTAALCPFEEDVNVPIPDSSAPALVLMLVEKGLMYLGMGQGDKAEDGSQKPITKK